ncbi:MAG: hypothetical protein G01um101419_499 [Parcubacteria group bacterium Gr01-1014_19]|nr:MAG: hypothetical protein G01um101419_499 [Parcubacteria group bacterium Gr01-1014_19]
MNKAPSFTTQESAAKIMGRSFISIEEVLELFPECKAWVKPADYKEIPFHRKTLYGLSAKQFQYVLFPVVPFGNLPKNLQYSEIKTGFEKRFPEISAAAVEKRNNLDLPEPANLQWLYAMINYYLSRSFQADKWYLLSGIVRPAKTLVGAKECGLVPYKMETSIIYSYAWTLFWYLRGKSVFSTKPFRCADQFNQKGVAEIMMQCGDAEIFVGPVRKNKEMSLGRVPSIVPNEK